MKLAWGDIIGPAASLWLGVVLLVAWLAAGPALDVTPRVPGMDRRGAGAETGGGSEVAVTPGDPLPGPGRPSTHAGQWLGFRGPQRSAIAVEDPHLPRNWPAAGPPQRWTVELGEGYAGAVIRDGRVYVLDYDADAQADTLRCLSLDDGQEIWRNGYPVAVTRNHGMSRTVPVLVEDRVITIGPRCHVACWDAETGESLWFIDLVRQYGATVPRWYTGQCPLVDGQRVILAPGGPALLLTVDIRTGELVWQSPNPRGWKMTHSSVMPMDLDGRRTYVYCGSGGVAGVAADDGTLLWESDCWPEQFASSPSPLVLPGHRLLLSSGYGSKIGSLILKLSVDAEGITSQVERQLPPQSFNSEQQTPILYKDYIYGVRKRGGGQLVCLNQEGQPLWDSGSDRFGHGPYLIADGLVLVLSDGGQLTMVEATPEAYRPLGTCEVFPGGHDAWGPLAMASGRLVLRDLSRMACLDLAEE